MALTIEDGSGVTGADSFETVAECTASSVVIFGASLSGSDAMKESALRRAFIFMGALNWLPDLWPTFGGTIPDAVKTAQMVLAREEFKTAGTLSPSVTQSGKKVLTGVGDLSWRVLAGPNTVDAARPVVTMAMDLLKPYLATGNGRSGSTVFVERA